MSCCALAWSVFANTFSVLSTRFSDKCVQRAVELKRIQTGVRSSLRRKYFTILCKLPTHHCHERIGCKRIRNANQDTQRRFAVLKPLTNRGLPLSNCDGPTEVDCLYLRKESIQPSTRSTCSCRSTWVSSSTRRSTSAS